jgi:hypothetical protein
MDAHGSNGAAIISRGEAKTAMSPVVAEILRHNPSAETLRDVLALQREWEANEARKAYTTALVGLNRDLPPVIRRDAVVDFASAKGRTHYTHASLANVMEEVKGPVTQHGFSLAWRPSTANGKVSVTCRLTHQEGHFEECTLEAPVDNTGNKSPAQGVASTITLLERYSALALLGIATADMKDPAGDAERPQAAGDAIDSKRNLRAVGRLVQLGRTREDAEQFLGRKVADWTGADLEKLSEWTKATSAPEVSS